MDNGIWVSTTTTNNLKVRGHVHYILLLFTTTLYDECSYEKKDTVFFTNTIGYSHYKSLMIA